MAEADRRERDMVLAPNEYAFISDETKGEINLFCGPNKTSLAGSDRPVVFNTKTKRFTATDMAGAVCTNIIAPEGFYVVLKNPAENDKMPTASGKLTVPELRIGKKVNISGPACFALWPGQMAKIVAGHALRSNEYLLCRVYDEKAARENQSKGIVKSQIVIPSGTENKDEDKDEDGASKKKKKTVGISGGFPSADSMTMGQLFVVRGTEVAFYIPPTGIEVVPEKVNGEERYVREAVSLERLEYCLLLDQDGNKRYFRGPDVVFPKPTEKFVDAAIKSSPDKARAKKFRAQELTPTSGIHIRVIADYKDEVTGKEHKTGDELFITGADEPVYFPREEHAIIKYGEQDVHYGIAIPPNEARYVLNRLDGNVRIEEGPTIFLADPRIEVIAQRALPLKLCELLYPGNNEALEINAARLGVSDQDFMGAGSGNAAWLNSSYTRDPTQDENYGAVAAAATPDASRGAPRGGYMIKSSSKALPGESFDRKSKFTAPRSVILNTKFDGSVTVNLWTGFAMLLVRGNDRRVVQGPGRFMLEYDENPQVLTLSTGKPKTTDKPFPTVYLKTTANMVSDEIQVETKDFCTFKVRVSYRVNFEGDNHNKWFAVDNYVKFLCDHMRSKLRNAVRRFGVEEFYNNHNEIVRDVVLGKSTALGAPRPGTTFDENSMRIYDVEVLAAGCLNPDVEKLLVGAQRENIQNTLLLQSEQRKLEYNKTAEHIKRENNVALAETLRASWILSAENSTLQLESDLKLIEANSKKSAASQSATKEQQSRQHEITAFAKESEIALITMEHELAEDKMEKEIEFERTRQELRLLEIKTQVDAVVQKAAAISPDLIAALSVFGERALVEKVAEAMGPLSIIGGGKKSVVEILQDMLKGTALASQLGSIVGAKQLDDGVTPPKKRMGPGLP